MKNIIKFKVVQNDNLQIIYKIVSINWKKLMKKNNSCNNNILNKKN